ncbi:MAG TPA: hypothetical protein VFH44_06985 [Solirubrobacterales bacterium]|nr:hypothetical protein [Solirubrobacterales bacterium]
MGFLDKLKEKGRGVVTAAKPEDGVAPEPADEVKRRLLAISGKGIEAAAEDDGKIIVAWSAQVASAGPGGAAGEYLYRAFEITLDESDHEAAGIGLKTTSDAEVGLGGSFSAGLVWERGQHIGSETMHVIAWLGPHRTEGGADESGYKFAWSDLRDPIIEAVTGAGWTYKPKKI